MFGCLRLEPSTLNPKALNEGRGGGDCRRGFRGLGFGLGFRALGVRV